MPPDRRKQTKVASADALTVLTPAPPLRPKQGTRIPRPPIAMEPLPPIRSEQTLKKGKQSIPPSSVAELLNATLNDEPPYFRTFDKTEGRVVLHSSSEIPHPGKRAGSIFLLLKKDQYEVEQAELRVTTLSEVEQVRLAAMSLKRKAQRELKRTIRKGLLDANAALIRTQQTLLADFNDTVGHLHTDTQELSLIRVHNAATDEVLFQKAQYMAKLEIDRFQAVVIGEDVTPTDILSMQLDAFRHKHVVPFPAPRKRRSDLDVPTEGRRRSSDRGAGTRTGIHIIVEKQLQALHHR
jgi:hypothetical protein